MPFITIENQNNKISFNPSLTLLNNLLISKIPIETYCGGRGRCGKCRIKILTELKYVSPKNKVEKVRLKHLLDEGWRLACQTYSLRDVTIYIPPIGSEEGIIKL